MGIEVPLRAQGYGKKLLQAAITWAKDQNSLTWIDLSVFAHNLPARKLYANSGFKEIATIEDRLLIDGLTIDDVIMTLKLK